MSDAIQTADLEWQQVDGIDVPVSKQFGDVYFSKDNGLLETRHVFLNGNDLSPRLAALADYDYFCVGETGFGTGLNILALWQLWQQVRPNNHSHLHAISVEKFPLSKADLIRALNAWPELAPLAEQLIAQYPLPIAGCHRLSFPKERFSLDLWLGDAQAVFPAMVKTQQVNAWFLDGFAPSCNPDMWAENVLQHIIRLSGYGTTFASFSVAGVLKRGLSAHGVQISRPRGFGHKREMLKAIWQAPEPTTSDGVTCSSPSLNQRDNCKTIAVLGAGIAGLSVAWALAQRGHQVKIYERKAALSGASGNPLALLNPKLSPIQQSHTHLMTICWQHALRHYAQFLAFRPLQVNQLALKKPDELLDLAQQYPAGLLHAQTPQQSLLNTPYASLKLSKAGAVFPHQLRDQIVQHPLIQLEIATIKQLVQSDAGIEVFNQAGDCIARVDHAVVCCAQQSADFFENYPLLKPIRGQVSWIPLAHPILPVDQAFSYGGYCMQLDPQHLILGASFHPQRDDSDVLLEDHQHNADLFNTVFPGESQDFPAIERWQGRASIRAQSPDYFPVLGKLDPDSEIYTFAGLGSKGFLFAPLCSEVLAALILEEACPVPEAVLQRLNPQRFFKKSKSKKPYHAQKAHHE
ncbi:FAD-dependent 5-carboxymethylaminomethyl-2-thiouridine(34) oxidoreductase MnmC [Acinetobacter sp. CAAS 2-6]|uniref:FAD-dependent 5-carboxymethylaminomethyl-2-thiouridine(34) oxidoreductase MnmC n=1 Tax=Acinetobacter sp. CAAS 2-6 TaxID=3016358 RepID=UPI002DD61BD4|nr:FAD-dependent 5-carboxymethylaminomethyl-2-thiouridine(34) oxidoreductase MnmC [Acinetobacter sp. CAAS 2-6]